MSKGLKILNLVADMHSKPKAPKKQAPKKPAPDQADPMDDTEDSEKAKIGKILNSKKKQDLDALAN